MAVDLPDNYYTMCNGVTVSWGSYGDQFGRVYEAHCTLDMSKFDGDVTVYFEFNFANGESDWEPPDPPPGGNYLKLPIEVRLVNSTGSTLWSETFDSNWDEVNWDWDIVYEYRLVEITPTSGLDDYYLEFYPDYYGSVCDGYGGNYIGLARFKIVQTGATKTELQHYLCNWPISQVAPNGYYSDVIHTAMAWNFKTGEYKTLAGVIFDVCASDHPTVGSSYTGVGRVEVWDWETYVAIDDVSAEFSIQPPSYEVAHLDVGLEYLAADRALFLYRGWSGTLLTNYSIVYSAAIRITIDPIETINVKMPITVLGYYDEDDVDIWYDGYGSDHSQPFTFREVVGYDAYLEGENMHGVSYPVTAVLYDNTASEVVASLYLPGDDYGGPTYTYYQRSSEKLTLVDGHVYRIYPQEGVDNYEMAVWITQLTPAVSGWKDFMPVLLRLLQGVVWLSAIYATLKLDVTRFVRSFVTRCLWYMARG